MPVPVEDASGTSVKRLGTRAPARAVCCTWRLNGDSTISLRYPDENVLVMELEM